MTTVILSPKIRTFPQTTAYLNQRDLVKGNLALHFEIEKYIILYTRNLSEKPHIEKSMKM